MCKNGEVEDEFHFSLKCKLYEKERSTLFSSLSDISTFDFKTNPDAFILLMNTNYGDHEFATSVCHFTKTCFEARKLQEATFTKGKK
jgi:hypothetical protein